MQSSLIILVSIFLIVLLNLFLKKRSFLLDNKSLSHKSFASKVSVPITGGFVILFNLLLFSNNYFALIFFTLIFFLGIFSDLLIIVKPLKKFILQFLVIFCFLYFFDLKVLSKYILLTCFLKIKYLQFFLLLFVY
jgi:hypothetical protein